MKSMNLFSGSLGSEENPSKYVKNPMLTGQYWFMLNNPLSLNPKHKEEKDESDDQEETDDASYEEDEMNNDLDLELENDSDDFEDDDYEDESLDGYA